MAITPNHTLRDQLSGLRLRLAGASLVTDYRSQVVNALAVDRLWLVHADDGRAGSWIGDAGLSRRLPLRTGYAYLLPCHHEVRFELVPGASWVSLHFNLDLIPGLDVFAGHNRCEEVAAPEQVAKAQRMMAEGDLVSALCLCNELVFGIAAGLLRGQTAGLRRGAIAQGRYGPVFESVRTSCDARLTVEALAIRVGMRPDVFSRAFTRDVGITPKRFLTTSLLRRASELLLVPGTTARRVAAELGFSSESYLSRFFRKHSGMTPLAYQRMSGGR